MQRAVLEGRGQGGLFARDTIRDGHEPKSKGMPVWLDSKWTLEKLQVEMQLVERCEWHHLQNTDRWTGTVWCPCVTRPTERGESKNVAKRCEVRGRQQTHPGTATVETRTLDMHNAATRNCRHAVGMESEGWPDPRQRTKNGRFWFVAAKGTPPLNVVERESLPDRGGDAREGKTKQCET